MKFFGTDGIRGRMGEEPITPSTVMKLGWALGNVLGNHGDTRGKVIIGKDTRVSGYLLESAMEAGLISAGVDVSLLGPMPTPGIAYLTRTARAQAGVVISASHNPYYDNGIKFFSPAGEKLSDEVELAIEEMMQQEIRTVDSRDLGKATRYPDAAGRYIEYCKATIANHVTLDGLHIVLDCANGATCRIAPELFSELGAQVDALGIQPDGKNINDDCGSEHPEGLIEKVLKSNADIGLAFDGDGDRLIAVDEKGGVLSGDQILAICAKDLKQKGRLKNDLVVSTVMSNMGLGVALQNLGIRHETARVGDRYVMEKMIAAGAILGGEDSGHIIFADDHTSGDGILSALKLIEAMQSANRTLFELRKVMTVYPQVLINVDVETKPDINTVPAIADAIKSVETELGERGRVLVRYSGTQPLCRVMVEGPSVAETRRYCEQLSEIIKVNIGT